MISPERPAFGIYQILLLEGWNPSSCGLRFVVMTFISVLFLGGLFKWIDFNFFSSNGIRISGGSKAMSFSILPYELFFPR